MNENRPEDEPNQGFGPKPENGLSVSREDTEGRSPPPRSRRRGTSTTDRLWQAAQADESIVAHWFLPVAGLVLVLLIVSIIMYFSHGNQLNALNREVTTLRDQAQTTPSAEIDRILAQVDELGSRLSALEERNVDVQALRDQLTEHNERVEALANRVETLEQTSGSAAGTATGSGNTGSGEWIVNLITLGDRAAAERFQERLDELGIESRIEATTSGDKTLQRVVVPGFSSHEAAEKVVPDLKQRLELSDDPWITRQRE